MAELRYTKTHEWCAVEGEVATCGISKHAAEELNDLTFLDYRVEAGEEVSRGDVIGEIDSVKATSELFAPVSGTVKEVNERFQSEDELQVITDDPESEGWLVKIQLKDTSELGQLMSADAYREFCAQEDGH